VEELQSRRANRSLVFFFLLVTGTAATTVGGTGWPAGAWVEEFALGAAWKEARAQRTEVGFKNEHWFVATVDASR
jgi:hypothetical protein